MYMKKMSVAQACLNLCDPMDCSLCPWNSPSKNTGVNSHSLLQKIFPNQRLNPSLHIAGRFTREVYTHSHRYTHTDTHTHFPPWYTSLSFQLQGLSSISSREGLLVVNSFSSYYFCLI